MVIEQPERRYITINALRLHYLEWGHVDSPPMILLHGVGDTAHIWDHFAPHALSQFRMIALDQRGHGDSDWAVPPAYRCEDYVRDLATFIKDLQLNRVVLLGHSVGALHATMYASMRPDRVGALIHVDIEPCPPAWNKEYLNGLHETLPAYYQSIQEFADQVQENSPYANKEMLAHIAFYGLNERGDGKFFSKTDREVYNHFDQYDVLPYLAEISCPTLIVRGEESRVTRREIAQEMNRAIEGSKLVEIPQATHPVHTDNPHQFHKAVLDFLKNLNLT